MSERTEKVSCGMCGAPISARNMARHAKSCSGTPRLSWQERFWALVDKEGPNGCWIWSGNVDDRNGYGRFHTSGASTRRAHRIAWQLSGKELSDGLVLDHQCRVRTCVNPDHLRQVEQRVNALENSVSPVAMNASKDECVKGHPFNAENTYVHRGGRYCRTCQRDRNRERNERLRGNRLRAECPVCGKELAKATMSAHVKRMHQEGQSVR